MKKYLKSFFCLMILCTAVMAAVECHAEEAKGMKVEYHTQQEIRNYLEKNKINVDAQTSYNKTPSLKKPYNEGSLSSKSLKSALATLNAVRYVAGLDANVKLDDEYNKQAQTGALLNAINGKLSHWPEQPKGMSESMYWRGRYGASCSNLAWTSWKSGLGYSIVNLWMNDGDASNIAMVGHRRWILNPPMEKTGFGWVNANTATYSAVYVSDNVNGENPKYYGVAWPAQNMPVEWFGSSYPWSISMGTTVDASKVKVTLTRKSDKKKWTFSEKKSKGYFNVDNDYYGQTGCIIFRPENVTYAAGDSFTVKITGLEETVSYEVNFFSADVKQSECSHSYKEETVTKATFSSNGKVKKVCKKCGYEKTEKINKVSSVSLSKKTVTYNGKTQKPTVLVKDSKGKALSSDNYKISYNKTPEKAGCYVIKVKLKGHYSGSKELTYTIKPKTVEIKKITAKKGGFQITTKKGSGITGYQICYSRKSDFSSAEIYDAEGSNHVKNTIKNLKSGKKYYVKVRTYKKVTMNGKTKKIYSFYSKAKTIKVK